MELNAGQIGTTYCSSSNQFVFRNFSEETVSHLFLIFIKFNSVWDFIINLPYKLTGYTISMVTSNFFSFFNFLFLNVSHCQKQIDAIVFLKVLRRTQFGLKETT